MRDEESPSRLAKADLARVLALNNAHATETSALTMTELERLLDQAAVAVGFEGGAGAFLIALDQAGDYDSPNFSWFRARHSRFFYIDRVVTAPDRRGQGLARRLYAALIAEARRLDCPVVGCEVNIDPPNPVSDAFHAALGFVEVGTAILPGRGKTVRYLELPVTPRPG